MRGFGIEVEFAARRGAALRRCRRRVAPSGTLCVRQIGQHEQRLVALVLRRRHRPETAGSAARAGAVTGFLNRGRVDALPLGFRDLVAGQYSAGASALELLECRRRRAVSSVAMSSSGRCRDPARAGGDRAGRRRVIAARRDGSSMNHLTVRASARMTTLHGGHLPAPRRAIRRRNRDLSATILA